MRHIVFYCEPCGDWGIEFDEGDLEATALAQALMYEHLEECENAQRVKDERLRQLDLEWPW